MKKGFLDGYKTYNTADGFGDAYSWKSNFRKRMGFEEAKTILEDEGKSPEQILGITDPFYTFDYVREVFRKLIFEHHPDRGGDTKKAQRIIAAYTILKHRFGEK